jgi:hypothetical protein
MSFKLRQGRLWGGLLLDRNTLMPSVLSFADSLGGGRVVFEKWASTDTPPLARHVVMELNGSGAVTYDVQDARIWMRKPPKYSDPRQVAIDSGFMQGVGASVAALTPKIGPWYVNPKIDGQQRGWFALDPSSRYSLMSRALGKELEYMELGADQARGSAYIPDGPTTFYQSRFLQLGPFLFEGPMYRTVDELPKAPDDGDVLGVLGWDIFIRSVVVLDRERKTVQLYDAEGYQPAKVEWLDIDMIDRVPCVKFMLLDIYPDGTTKERLVRVRLDLFEPQASAIRVRQPTTRLTENYVLIGEKECALLHLGAEQLEALSRTPYVDGIMGLSAFPPGQVIFDFSRQRVGFVKQQ